MLAKPCAVFWDIENSGVPKGQTVNSIVDLIRSTIIKPYNLDEIFFFCVCDVHKLSANDESLRHLDFQAYNGLRDSVDIKILDLMRRFVKVAGQDCTIILLGGDVDYYDTLSDLKKLHNVSIHLIGLADSYSPKLEEISDYIFMSNDGVLKSIKSTGAPKYFISVVNYSPSANSNQLMNEINDIARGSIENSAILYGSSISKIIGFPSLCLAEKAILQLNGSRYHRLSLKAELIKDSPLTDILKSIKIEKSKQSKTNQCCEVKQLTFIRIPNVSDSVDNSKFIKFCVACTAPNGTQCILSRKSSLWIVFSLESDAQNFLSKVKIIYSDAYISEPPSDLSSPCKKNPYNIQFCEEQNIVSNTAKPYEPSITALFSGNNFPTFPSHNN